MRYFVRVVAAWVIGYGVWPVGPRQQLPRRLSEPSQPMYVPELARLNG